MEGTSAAVLAMCGFTAMLTMTGAAQAQSNVPVTVGTFVRAETDNYMANNAKAAGGIGKMSHRREPASIDDQTVIRLNRDTLYSFGVFDLAAGPVTVALPDAGKRFMSLMVINEDHYVPFVAYDHKPHTLTEKSIGSRYVVVAVRTLVDPNDPKDLDAVHKLQDAVKVSQKDAGKLDLPNWDQASLKEIQDALLVLAKHTDGFQHAFGTKATVDPISHLIGTAAGWGGNPDRDASYIVGEVPKNDGRTVYKVTVPATVPVDAFWSVTVYNAKGYLEKNQYDAYSVNSVTGKKNADGSVTVQLGGCDGKISNCLPIMNGWNYTVRLYRPHAEILNGTWKFPVLQAVN